MPTVEELQQQITELQNQLREVSRAATPVNAVTNVINVVPPAPYDPANDWECWEDQLDLYYSARKVTADDDKRTLLLQQLGNRAYSDLKAWCDPDKPVTKPYPELLQILQSRYGQTKDKMLARLQLSSVKQAGDEPTPAFIRKMTTLAAACKFPEEASVIQEIIRGLYSDDLRLHLLRIENRKDKLAEFKQVVDAYLAFQSVSSAMQEARVPKQLPTTLNVLQSTRNRKCYRCGEPHDHATCMYKDFTCNYCKKPGHIRKACKKRLANESSEHRQPRSRQNSQNREPTRPNTNQIYEEEPQDYPDSDGGYPQSLNSIQETTPNDVSVAPYWVPVTLNGNHVRMQHDSGACATIIDQNTWKLIGSPPLHKANIFVSSYQKNPIELLGRCLVQVQVNGQSAEAWTLVNKKPAVALFGRPWIHQFQVPYAPAEIHSVESKTKLSDLLTEFKDTFEEKMGKCDIQAELLLKPDATPVFGRLHSVPYSLKEEVREQIESQVKCGILIPVEQSTWASPIVIVRKPVKLRICGDYSKTLNPALIDDPYPMPRIDDLLHQFNDTTHFTKIDLRDAYHQLILSEKSRELTTIRTPFGLFSYSRLPFGIKTATAIFQKTIEKILQGIPGVVIYLDDITVATSSETDHLSCLREVLMRMRKHDLKIRADKCSFFQRTVDFLGFHVDRTGVRPSPCKLDGLRDMTPPTDLKKLEAFIGYINYYRKFIKNLSTLMAPLDPLRRKDAPWVWETTQQQAFDTIKEALLNSEVLTHYDVTKKLYLAADASDYGIGAVIYHREDDGTERIVANASRKLTAPEQNYSQTDKEALAIIFGLEKFSTYLLGRKFQLYTDHQPLKRIFGPQNEAPIVAARRLSRWQIRMKEFNYDIEYKKTSEFACADGLSRLPSEKTTPSQADNILCHEVNALHVAMVEESPIDWNLLAQKTATDPVLSIVQQHTLHGWPDKPSADLKPWSDRRLGLTTQGSCLFFNEKPVVPEALIPTILRLLHAAHVGQNRMITILRDACWFPNMAQRVGEIARSCAACNEFRPNKPKRLHPWEPAPKFWARVHLDYAGPFLNAYWLICIDAFSNWLEAFKTKSPDTASTIKALQELFVRHGFPQQLVTDNGPAFRSEEFASFCSTRNITLTKSPPYHPESNGPAERAVRTFKEMTMKYVRSGHSVTSAVQQTLLVHRVTKKAPGEKSPAEKATGRQFTTKLTLIPRESHSTPNTAVFFEGQGVWYRSYTGPFWKRGVVSKIVSHTTYMIADGESLHFRHQDQVRPAAEENLNCPVPVPAITANPHTPLPPSAPVETSQGPQPHPPRLTPQGTPEGPRRSSRIAMAFKKKEEEKEKQARHVSQHAPPVFKKPSAYDKTKASEPRPPRPRIVPPGYPSSLPTEAKSDRARIRAPVKPPLPAFNRSSSSKANFSKSSIHAVHERPSQRRRTQSHGSALPALARLNEQPPSVTAKEARTQFRRAKRHVFSALKHDDPEADDMVLQLEELSRRWNILKRKEGSDVN